MFTPSRLQGAAAFAAEEPAQRMADYEGKKVVEIKARALASVRSNRRPACGATA